MTPLADPHFLPFKLDPVTRRVLLLRMDAVQRREAAFLDERALKPDAEGGWLPLATLRDATLEPAPPAAAIFHIGHCGSTLLSRLLEAWPGVQSLREPLPLRTLAEAWPHREEVDSRLAPPETDALLQQLWRAWSRPLAGATRTVIKATSGCNGLIAPLLAQQPALRALLLDMPLRPYLATLLKSADSVRDAAVAAGERLRDLHAHGYGDDVMLHALSLPQQCAMGWLAERVRFAALAQAHPQHFLRVDFEHLLAHPQAVLQAIAAHLSLDPAGVAAALQAPAWGRYAKAQDHGYGRDDRAHDLALAMQRHADGISEGVAWVDARLQRHPQLQALA
ncbi:sulfotransferase [Lysobacter solisilvae (ex Woo and Kim 2020)]|uniref:Sulfotransferase n=1 Tax=Agrilutibacter terrestris TaxID=2865112 RepID=A0A7H0G0Z6_9GAMM|nr:sulfotransferase [Lysobacter terrestris]QNP41962.1 sulfotransferase [Lysobacter terrestris]